MADHRTTFSATEWIALRVLVEHLESADTDDQKRLRDGLRGLGFYITDFDKAGARFSLADLQHLLNMGGLRING